MSVFLGIVDISWYCRCLLVLSGGVVSPSGYHVGAYRQKGFTVVVC